MRKDQRQAVRLAKDLGLTLIDTYYGGRHFMLVLRTPRGVEFKQPLPSDMSTTRHWKNFTAHLKSRLNQESTK